MAFDTTINQHFRCSMSGPETSPEEVQLCIDKLINLSNKPDYIVASGSLPPGLPDDFFGYAHTCCVSESIYCHYSAQRLHFGRLWQVKCLSMG